MTTDDFIFLHATDDVRKLALSTFPEGVDLPTALTQIEGRQLALKKLPSWASLEGIRWPKRISLEQCSSEATSRYKRRIIESSGILKEKHRTFADLTAGLGVDFAALAPWFDKAYYVECQEELCALARRNLPLLGCAHAVVICGEGEGWLAESAEPLDLIMIDPARRDQAGRKVMLIEDCTPDVCAMQQMLRRQARWTLIKLSPMLDITAALRVMQGVVAVHVVSVEGECKEVLLLMASDESLWLSQDAVPVHCVNLKQTGEEAAPIFTFTRSEEQQMSVPYASRLGSWLYEPHASLLKAGAFKSVAERYGLHKLAPMSHLYTNDECVSAFPGRIWQVEAWSTFQKKDLRQLLAGLDEAELSVRGFPMSVASLRQKLKLRDGGGAHFIATTLVDGQKVLVKVRQVSVAPQPSEPQDPQHR